jgi:hypothetical protein
MHVFAVVRVEPDVMGEQAFRDTAAGLTTVITVVWVWGSG